MIKDLKLSDAMIKMITEAQYHEVLVNGEIVHRGYMVAGRVGTVVALMDRGLCTARTVEYHGVHWLTGLGLRTWAWITGNDLPASEDHPAESDMITDADRLNRAADAHYANMTSADANLNCYLSRPNQESARAVSAIAEEMFPDIEHETVIAILSQSYTPGVDSLAELISGYLTRRALLTASIEAENAAHEESEAQWADVESASDYDRRNADLERADIESEYRAEAEAEASEAAWVPTEVINADDFMYRTRKGIFLSAGYFRTMRLVREDRLRALLAFKAAQKLIRERYSGGRVTFLDEMLADGKVSFTAVDKARRTILAVCSPKIGSKIKPSSKKRNKR